jgi:hypothetical protein
MKFKIWFNDGTAGIWTLPKHIKAAQAERYFKGVVFRNHVALLTEITRDVVRVEPHAQ